MPATLQPLDRPMPLPGLLGETAPVRTQVLAVLFSSATYLVYGLISAVQVAMGLMSRDAAGWLVAAGTLANLGFYIAVRSGRFVSGIDPGLSRAQLVAGILLMYAAYAAVGPAATGLLVVMASHIVYSMFSMTPRQVWWLVGSTLAGLAATMLACGLAWPERYNTAVQLSGLLYALLVMPLIALLAYRVTAMTQRLKAQHLELETANARLRELATRDELTRTHNRRHMTELLVAEQSQHRRQGAPLALALLDVDRFKSVNDHHGHAVGDEVLRAFAQATRDQLRTADHLARWGGEEFLVLMPFTSRADAVVTLNRLQRHLADHAAALMPLGLTVSFSAGVVEVQADEAADAAVERADQAMYRAKNSGRARCIEG